MESDQSWEFNCPQYVNFCSPITEAGSRDSYFEIDHETGLRVSRLFPRKHTGRTPLSQVNGTFGSSTSTPGNQRSSLSFQKPSTTKKRKIGSKSVYSGPSQYDLRLTPARKVRQENSILYDSLEDSTQTYSENKPIIRSLPNSKSSVCHGNRSMNSNQGSSEHKSADHSEHSLEPSHFEESFEVKHANRQKNKPVSISKTTRSTLKSTDDMNLKMAKEFRAQLAAKRKLNEKNMRKAMAARKPHTSSSIMSQHTVVKPFHFKTDERLKNIDAKPNVREVDFVSALRRNSPKQKQLAITKPKPFNLTEMKKRKREFVPAESQKTMAEQIATFHRQTPDRFRSAVPGAVFKPTAKRFSPRLVRPCSPNLQAAKRHRAITAISKEEEEEIELQKIKAYKFQAKPFNPNLFSESHCPKIQAKHPIKPKLRQLQTQKRLSRQRDSKKNQVEEKKYEFHAQEIPKNILKTRVGIKEKQVIPATEPRSPAFALKTRSQKWKALNCKEPEQPTMFKALPLPRPEAPFALKLEKKCTSIAPFSFDQIDKQRFAQKEMKIQEEIEKENRVFEFRARNIPSPRPSNLPAIPKKPTTKPEPFNLLIDKLAEQKALRWQREVEQQLKIQQEAMNFKAQPATVVKKPPFVPEKSTKPPTEFSGFQLSTERRALERESLNKRRMTADAELEAAALLRSKEQEAQEQEEMRQLRKVTVHKANPIRNYGHVEIKPSLKPLTLPQSPKFATSNRVRN